MKHPFDTTLQNLRYIAQNWLRWDKKGTALVFLRVPVLVLVPTVTALIPKLIVDAVTAQIPLRQFMWLLLGMALAAAFLSWLDPFMEEKLDAFQQHIGMRYAVQAFEKLLYLDYASLESYEGRQKLERCKKFAFEGKYADGAWAAVRLTGLCTGLLGIFAYTLLLSLVHPLLIVIILAACALEFLCYRAINRLARVTEEQMVRDEMGFAYFFRVAADPAFGKEARLTGAADWLLWHLARHTASYEKIMRWFTRGTTRISAWQTLCALGRDAAVFGFLLYAVLQGKTSAADFLFCFGLAAGFSAWLNGLAGHISSLQRIAGECRKYREFLALPQSAVQPGGAAPFAQIDQIEFRNVSFAYDTGEPVLKNISCTVRGGESIAIVGENGAGKTTLVKLLCGLYRPTSGQILVNGIDITQLDSAGYFRLFSAVFQDYTLLPASILANIAIAEQADEARVRDALQKANLLEKTQQLRDGIHTKLVKQLNADAAELSGGETQRLLLARALYRDAPILVLDEPTAALDPLAEEKLYLQYREFTRDKTSFYISHRLTSTRFCERILFLRDGEIAESGSHDALLQRGGAYSQMYEVQGFYYREEVQI